MPALPNETETRHVLSIVLDNEPGALGRVVGLFSGRGYNINSLTVSEIDKDKHLSRITITMMASERIIEHIMALLERLVPVHKVRNVSMEGPFVERGIVLIKVEAKGDKRDEIARVADNFDASEVDATDSTLMFELHDIPSKLDEFIELMKNYGIVELSRTGITAMARGKDGF